MVRLTTFFLIVSMTLVACVTTDAARQTYIGPTDGRCLDVGSECRSSGDCCSDWCAAGACTLRGGGG